MCGNKYDEIREWIRARLKRQHNLSFDSLLFVSGKSGIGKTHNVKAICEELGLYVAYITSSQCCSSAELQDVIVKNITSSMLQLLTNDKKDKVIVIDELETMMALDRMINTTLYNLLQNDKKMRNIPIVCISSCGNMKKMGNIKKKCKIVELDDPTNEEICGLLHSMFPERTTADLRDIVEQSNSNIEQCIHKARSTPGCNSIDESANQVALYSTTFDRDTMKRIVTDVLVPLNYHENLVAELKKRSCNIKVRQGLYKEFLWNFIIYDGMVCKNSTEIPTDFFVSMIYPATRLPLKKNATSSMDNFTKTLSYQSLQKKNVKKTYCNLFPLYQINNYHINMLGRKYIFFN